MKNEFNFNISLSVLNHLGRNLYRNVITVLGEALSNAWDADANTVKVYVDKATSSMCIVDDGDGMTAEDFQDKFLKIGYSKRKGNNFTSSKGRPFIGRKGIGKLALLSCARKVHIASKAYGSEVIGGVIDNSELDEAITDDLNSQEYKLGPLDNALTEMLSKFDKGTLLFFESITDGIYNSEEYLKKAMALYFRFSLIDENFNIFINDKRIDYSELESLATNTQFLWTLNDINDPFLDLMTKVEKNIEIITPLKIRGYIATVNKPSTLKIRGTQEKVTLDLFVNGRLREKDILRHMPTSRIVENYIYGQIHYDNLDQGDCKDVFTSSREGVISGEPEFRRFLGELEKIVRKIIDEWDDLRRASGNDGDPDNKKISKKARKAEEMFNAAVKEMEDNVKFVRKGGVVESWVNELSEEAQFNVPSYMECFISENLLRKYILHKNKALSEEAIAEAQKWQKTEATRKKLANISYDIRSVNSEIYYLDMDGLANMVDKVNDKLKDAGLSRSAVVYKPLRDAVGHTSMLTENAKKQLNIEYENIKARLANLLNQI